MVIVVITVLFKVYLNHIIFQVKNQIKLKDFVNSVKYDFDILEIINLIEAQKY